jgi:predicted transcriptional regulator
MVLTTYTRGHYSGQEAELPKDAVFTMKLEAELRDEFVAEAEAAHRPASQVVRELMREFVRRQREERDYDAFLEGKVERARASMRAGQGLANEDVEADFAARRARLTPEA